MSENDLSLEKFSRLWSAIDEFARVRDWEKFHTAKNLSMALTVEAAELMEIYQWVSANVGNLDVIDAKRDAVEQEVADIFIYLVRFCSVCRIDLLGAAERKLAINEAKYPADVVKGRSDKYTEYKK